MFQQPKEADSNLSGLDASSSNASGAPTLANVTSESLIGFLGEFPPDTEEQYLPEHMVSESSAEDDMTLGPDPDSIDPPHHPHLLILASQGSSMPGIPPPQMPSSAAMNLESSNSAYHHGLIATPMSSTQAYLNQTTETFDLPHPSTRVKRSSPTHNHFDPLLMPSMPNPLGHMNGNNAYTGTDSPYSGIKSNARRRTSSARATSVSDAPSGSNTGASEGYYYRSRDKTNYSQAHKGTLPSPPMTPESQKRIRCTWSLEETRMLFELLKDTTIDTFPDAQHIRSHLLRMDPLCNKSLDHVRNKKANLIQKAHSKNVSVAEILISDMHKLEMELLGGSTLAPRGSGGVYTTTHLSSFFPGPSMSSVSASSSMDVSPSSHQMGTRSSSMQGSSAGASAGLVGSTSQSNASMSGRGTGSGPSSSPGTPSGAALTISLPVPTQTPMIGKVSTSMRPARRRVSKRVSATLLSTLNQPPTATAQQLAKVAAAQQQAQHLAQLQASAALASTPQISPTSTTTHITEASKLDGYGSVPQPLTPTSASANSLASTSPSTNTSALDPSSNSPIPAPNVDPSLAPMASYLLGPSHSLGLGRPSQPSSNANDSELQRWQRWVYEEITKLVAGQNEVRTTLRMMPIELSAPPVTVMPTQPLRLPVHSQWISSWNSGAPDSLDSETESSDEHSTGTLLDPSRKPSGAHW